MCRVVAAWAEKERELTAICRYLQSDEMTIPGLEYFDRVSEWQISKGRVEEN